MSDHLTALDATFLELEEADESAHMHIGAIMVFDPPADGAPVSREELCEHLGRRLTRLPRYRQRLSQPHTGGLSWPAWEEDPAFDLGRHISRAALPTPGGPEELMEWVSAFFSGRLDRHRPLWEMALLEGLAGGRWALATKTHHCMVDGVGSVDVGHLLLDVSPDAAARGLLAETPSPAGGRPISAGRGPASGEKPSGDGPLARLAHAWAGLVPSETIAHATQMGAHGLSHPREALHSARAALSMLVRDELHAAPHTSLNKPMSTRRRLEVVRVPLAELKQIKRSLGGTVNDVALAVTASGLRELLTSRGESLPADGLRAMVPMNVRVASDHLALGNRVSSLFIELPMTHPNAVQRYRETVVRSGALKSAGDQATGTTAIIELAGLAPPVLHATVAQALYATRLFNLTITNVPGPQQTLYACRSALREVYPLVPLAAAHDLGVAITSYDGNVFFGVVADPDTVPDLDVLVDALAASVEELLACARDNATTATEAAASPERARPSAAETT